MSPPLLPQDITMTETEETVLDLVAKLRNHAAWLDKTHPKLNSPVAFTCRQAAERLVIEAGRDAELTELRADRKLLIDAGYQNAEVALAALSRAPGGEDRLADEKQEVVAALYKAWPDAEDIPSDFPLGIIGCIELIISERDAALASLKVCRESLTDQASARRDATMPVLVPEVIEAWASEAEASYAMAETAEERRNAHGLSLLVEWQRRAALSPGGEGEANQVGAAEAEVGRYIYRRIERLMDAKPGTVEGAELCYLAEIAEGVEEYGEQACDGHPLGRFPHPSPEMEEDIALGDPCTLETCPPGLFLADAYGTLGMKSEYHTDKGAVEAYIVESGEFFWGDNPQTVERQRAQIVRPVPHDAILSKLNIDEGLLGEGDRGSARAGSGAAGPSDCAENDAHSDLEQTVCEALQDSLGPDWSAEVGARDVIDAIRERG